MKQEACSTILNNDWSFGIWDVKRYFSNVAKWYENVPIQKHSVFWSIKRWSLTSQQYSNIHNSSSTYSCVVWEMSINSIIGSVHSVTITFVSDTSRLCPTTGLRLPVSTLNRFTDKALRSIYLLIELTN